METKIKRERPILSICIPTTNRVETLIKHLKTILSSENQKFNVIVYDGKSTDGTEDRVRELEDSRLKFISNTDNNIGYQSQWFGALENADGIFAMHLNDRDMINMEELDSFIAFLEKHKDYSGGICKYLSNRKNIICHSFEESLMNVPYFAIHNTGVIIQIDAYKRIQDRFSMFLYEIAGSHPHDIILGRLCTMGNLFIYTNELWIMAPKEFYKKYRSGIKYTAKKQWFEPEERLHELLCCIKELDNMGISSAICEKKKKQIILNYLYLSTVGYYYLLEDEAETAHYGIMCRKLSLRKKLFKTRKIVELYAQEQAINCQYSIKFLYSWSSKKVIMIKIIQLAAPIRNSSLYKFLRNLYRKNQDKENAYLRY